MDVLKKEKIYRYLQEQIAQADFRTKAYVLDDQNNRNPTRNCYVKLQQHLNNYLAGDTEIRWIAIPGFRGVGKTTLLSQLYSNLNRPGIAKLYLSVDELVHIVGSNLSEMLPVYEEIIGTAFERLESPVVLFLDEVQYDQNWGITLKTIFDRSKKVFIFVTGSAAVALQSNSDVARRVFFEKLFPMSFSEYIKIKGGKFEVKGLSTQLRQSIFESSDAQTVLESLKKVEHDVRSYWSGIERLETERYMKFGTLPFALKLKNEGLVYDQIKKIIDRVVSMDISQLGQFKPEIIAKIQEVLYSVAATDTLSVNNLSRDLGMDKNTLSLILSVLEKTETLLRVYPYGAHATQVRKPSKYLFSSPAFRAMYFSFVGNIISQENYMGKLLEDTVGLYLSRCLSNKKASLTYDASQSGADFIIGINNEKIVAEVGYGKKGTNQVVSTSKKVNPKYGIVISMSPLSIDDSKQIVNIPLSYFLLI